MFRFGLPALLVLLGIAGLSPATEPQVAFVVEEPGWVKFTVQKEGKPVPDAEVVVFDENGTEFARGETGAEGSSQFPLPRRGSVNVEFKIDKRTSDPIPLQPTAGGVEPGRVLLSFGLRPCCRVISRGGVYRPEADTAPTPSQPSSRILPYTAVTVCVVGGLSLLVLALRPGGRREP